MKESRLKKQKKEWKVRKRKIECGNVKLGPVYKKVKNNNNNVITPKNEIRKQRKGGENGKLEPACNKSTWFS
ncbi:hypothetical protein RhiirA5_444239 [Rhizophagus irregularis]|uniref:Uncharacterized protein n=1 Tax=Rhizophagus irregularis TaxID=588596 RepID=A0A2N0NDC0_9GLOM|nr:hypothetical protein RhiirA5_444239 [Rhizophagus irregularis]PKC51210.1 hypothetical protein RhiirA1_484283 [Rhizophagus irregularis]